MKTLTRLIVAGGVSAMIITLMLKLFGTDVDDATRPSLLQLLKDTVRASIAIYIVLTIFGLLLRAIRYRILVKASSVGEAPSLFQFGLVTGVRNMMVDLLPARLGELIYVALLNRGYAVKASHCLSSLSIAVVFDFIALAFIIFISGLILVLTGDAKVWIWITFALVLVVVTIGVLSLTVFLPHVIHLLKRLPVRHKWFKAMISLAEQLNDSILTCRRAGVFGSVFLLSVTIRVLKYAGLFILFLAVASPAFTQLAEAPWEKVLAALVGAEISASLPIPTLMSFGTYETGGTLTLAALGFSASDSFLALLGVHVWSQSIDYGLGLICLLLFVFLVRSTQSTAMHRTEKLKIAAAMFVFLVGCFFLALQYRSHLKLGSSSAPPVGESLIEVMQPEVQSSLTSLSGKGIDGFVVWSSNRFGNHDILKMNLPSGKIEQLTTHPHTETWPRISADGRKLVFARSRETWVSQRNSVAWNVWIKDLGTGVETKITDTASYPFWVDENVIGYLKDGQSIHQYNLLTNKSEILFMPGQNNAVPLDSPLSSPDIHPLTAAVVFTTRQTALNLNTGFWGTGLWQQNHQLDGVLDGCELNWSYNGDRLYQVGHGGKQKTMFYEIDPETLQATPLLDLPGEYSHEYWPEDSNDGKYLVFGASKGDHEHDTADYEIFLWEIGQPASDATRLTFHTGNDNWPDIFVE